MMAKPENANPNHSQEESRSLTNTGRIGTTIPNPPAITNMENHRIVKARLWRADAIAFGDVFFMT